MQIGQTIGQYQITAFLGEGAMGKVFRGRDMQLNRDVAIKVLRPEISSRPDLVERFKNEAMTLASLHHGNICSVYAFIEHEGQHAMILQHLEGRSLEELLKEQGKFDLTRAKALLNDVLSGLQEAHSAGIVHRDLKPANLMITNTNKVVIMDFGIARVKSQQRATREGMMIGTLEYASPEQIRGEDVDARSDLYSLGIIAFEMLQGRLPFAARTDYEWVKAQTQETPDLTDIGKLFGRDAVGFLKKALEKASDRRFSSALEMQSALASWSDAVGRFGPLSQLKRQTNPSKAVADAVIGSSSLIAVKENIVYWVAGGFVLLGLGFVALSHWPKANNSNLPSGASTNVPPVEAVAKPPVAPIANTLPKAPETEPPISGQVMSKPVSPPEVPQEIQATAKSEGARTNSSTRLPKQNAGAAKEAARLSTGTETSSDASVSPLPAAPPQAARNQRQENGPAVEAGDSAGGWTARSGTNN